MNKSEVNLFNNLNKHPADKTLLRTVYLYRCLSVKQAMKYVYHVNDPSNQQTILRRLRRLGVITTSADIVDDKIIYLTQKGITAVRFDRSLPTEYYDHNKQKLVKGYYTAMQLKVKQKFVSHQIRLNEFMLSFQQKNHATFNLPWKYYDEAFISKYNTARPDGLLQLLQYDIFIEMDMATEASNKLYEKWDHYARFLNSSDFKMKRRKILVLFICDNIKNPVKLERRKELIRYTLSNSLVKDFHADFEFIIGSPSQILAKLFRIIYEFVNLKESPVVSACSQITGINNLSLLYGNLSPERQALLNDNSYPFELVQQNKNHQIALMRDTQPVHWMIDDYRFRQVSVLSHVDQYYYQSELFKKRYHYKPLVLVILNDDAINQGYFDFKLVNGISQEWLFFTTSKRLATMPFAQALFQYDYDSAVYHFTDNNLLNRVYEKQYLPLKSGVIHYKKVK